MGHHHWNFELVKDLGEACGAICSHPLCLTGNARRLAGESADAPAQNGSGTGPELSGGEGLVARYGFPLDRRCMAGSARLSVRRAVRGLA